MALTLTRRASGRIDGNGNPFHITYDVGELAFGIKSIHMIGYTRLDKRESDGIYLLSEEWAGRKDKFIENAEPTRNIHEAEQRIYDAVIKGIGSRPFEDKTPGRPVVNAESVPEQVRSA